MITEDYVSFETAKLLAEKGIEDDCEYTGWIGESGSHYFPDDIYLDDDTMIAAQKDRKEFVPLISLQMAMKWLREVHNIHIGVIVAYHHIPRRYEAHIMKLGNIDDFILQQQVDYASYEEACEEAVKYCLKNLI